VILTFYLKVNYFYNLSVLSIQVVTKEPNIYPKHHYNKYNVFKILLVNEHIMTTKKHIQGLTLIELMIVVAIIAIITSIAVPAYNGYIKTARIQECQQEMSSLALAQEEHFLEQRTFFAGGNVLALQGSSNGLWRAAEQDINKRNCSYAAVACGGGTIATCYTMTAIGELKLAGEGTIVTITKN